MSNELEKTIKDFIKEISKYPKGFHALYPGLGDKEIQQLEEDLQLSIPIFFKEVLKQFNGATLFSCDVEIWGIIRKSLSKSDNPAYDIVEQNLLMHQQGLLPSSYMVIGNYSYGSLICLDLSEVSTTDCSVVEWEVDSGTGTRTWGSTQKWLLSELKEGQNLFNYDGTEKAESTE